MNEPTTAVPTPHPTICEPVKEENTFLLGVILGLLGNVAGVTGDLVASMIKRTHGVKDTGKFLPGHGGMSAATPMSTHTPQPRWAASSASVGACRGRNVIKPSGT